jgi:predicted DNA-binding transcriptional regulator YafY
MHTTSILLACLTIEARPYYNTFTVVAGRRKDAGMRSETPTERALRRRLAILVLLHTGPRTSQEIIASLERDHLFFHDRALDPESRARRQRYQFKQDLEALRLLQYDLAYDRRQKRYSWRNSPFGLSLAPEQLSSLAMLLETFATRTFPHAAEIVDLLTFLADHLPIEQQQWLKNHRSTLHIDLRETTDYRNADPLTLKQIEQAIRLGQQLEFTYRTPRDGKERRHVIEPQPLVLRQGHVYLRGWSLDWGQELPFRLDCILPGTARVLPTSSAKQRPAPRSYTLRYWLSAVVARNKVSEHFPEHHHERHEDGSVTVTARITDLFEAAQTLFRYREHCIVLDPPELVERMRASAIQIYANYTREEGVQLNSSGDAMLATKTMK